MKSNFELEQSARILACYSTDISKGGKRANLGDIRVWGGKKYIKVNNGWMKYDHGNKKIDNHRKTHTYTSDTEQKFSHDQVIKDHIQNLSPEEKKEQLGKMKKKLDHLKKLQEKISDHNYSSKKAYNAVLGNRSIDKNDSIKQLTNKISEVKHGQNSLEDLNSLKNEIGKKISSLTKDNALKNADEIAELKQEYSGINHTIYRKFSDTSKAVVLSGHEKQYIDEESLFNDSTPWDEDLWDSEIDHEESKRIETTLEKQKIEDLNANWFGAKTFMANNSLPFNQGIPDEAKIKVTFNNGTSVERTFKQYKEFVDKVKEQNPEPELQKEPVKPMKPIMTGEKGSPEYKAKWREYFKKEEDFKKIQEENKALNDKYIKANVLPIKEIKVLSLK